LTFDRSGTIRVTPKGQTPSLGRDKLDAMLQRVAHEIREHGHPIEIPRSEGTRPGISQSVKTWQPYLDFHPFLQIWAEIKRSEKLLGFLGKLNSPTLHCRYSLLTRTGRTACSEPHGTSLPGVNLQQIPKASEFRGLFVPRQSDHQLFIADYSAIELRTLGAVCRAKFGGSKLADVIEQGLDPHAFTAAAIQSMSLEEFLTLKQTHPDRFRNGRQAAKAINFGVPGGLGAKALRDYAKSNYGVSLSEGEAEAFRSKLSSEVFSELNDQDGYLADTGMAALARNLGVQESLVWQTLDYRGNRNSIAARGISNVIRGSSTASPGYQQYVWDGLNQLVRVNPKLDDQPLCGVQSRQGSPELHNKLYHQKVATLTGRIRDGVGFTESKNTPFQSLAADGAKLALWNLLYAGFDLYGFIHDEIIVNLPPNNADQDAQQIKNIMERSMEEVLGGIPASCEWTVSDRWSKPG
jgi:DNA polymerase I-like protein with 3'-5' exonuclease and polymerase domains